MREITPGRMFSISTSHQSVSRRASPTPPGFFTSRVIAYLESLK